MKDHFLHVILISGAISHFEQLSPAEVQCVPHKTNEVASHSLLCYKLKPFSGRIPSRLLLMRVIMNRLAAAVSSFAWMSPTAISDPRVARKIMASLPAPAAEMVKSLDPRGTAVDDLTLLDSTGDELFVQFFNTNQNVGEKASDDLHRLQYTVLAGKLLFSLTRETTGIIAWSCNPRMNR